MSPKLFLISLLAISFCLGCKDDFVVKEIRDMKIPIQKLDFDTIEIDAEITISDLD